MTNEQHVVSYSKSRDSWAQRFKTKIQDRICNEEKDSGRFKSKIQKGIWSQKEEAESFWR